MFSTQTLVLNFLGVAVAGSPVFDGIKSTQTDNLVTTRISQSIDEVNFVFSTSTTATQSTSDSVWADVEALFGAWSNLSEKDVEAWLEDLRTSDRLSEIYGHEWD